MNLMNGTDQTGKTVKQNMNIAYVLCKYSQNKCIYICIAIEVDLIHIIVLNDIIDNFLIFMMRKYEYNCYKLY